jgi:AcrR family transcriptional regulator
MARKYEMKRRAERMRETRRRITEAAVELHQTVGPARTTVSAIAEKAGVQRHTYYAHFPELKDLYQACTAHYLEQNPLPEPPFWADVADAEERLKVALSEVYAYYVANEAMLSNVLRDAPLDPVAQENMASFYQYWEAMRDALADAFGASGERHEALLAAIALALDLQTWHTLVRQQELDHDRAVGLMVGMVHCLMWT